MAEEKSKTITSLQKILYVAGALGAIAGGITGFKTIKKEIASYIHTEVYKAVEKDVTRFEDTIHGLTVKVDNIIVERNRSFAIGLRVHTIENRLYYKAEDGKEYPAYKDINMSNMYNYPYYYFINPATGEREWCK
jgi:hypothetical protein